MKKGTHFAIINPGIIRQAHHYESCGQHSDAPYCPDPESDIVPGGVYRGCPAGQTDCADNAQNPDDVCCMGWGPGVGDNIDHASCQINDAEHGGVAQCVVWGGDTGK